MSSISPRSLSWMPTGPDDRLRFLVKTFEPPRSQPWLESACSPDESVTVTGGLEQERPGFGGKAVLREYRYAVQFSGGQAAPDTTRAVHILNRGASFPSLEIPLIIQTRPPVTVTPSILLAKVSGGETLKKLTLGFVATGIQEPLDVQPETMMDGITYHSLLREHSRQVFEVRIDTARLRGSRDQPAFLEFRTNHLDAPLVKAWLVLDFP